jgi:hypothetical protein
MLLYFPEQEEGYTAEDAETMELPDPEAAAAAGAADPFAKLERGNEDGRRGRVGRERLAELRADAEAKFGADYKINKALRRQLRWALVPLCVVEGCTDPQRAAQRLMQH